MSKIGFNSLQQGGFMYSQDNQTDETAQVPQQGEEAEARSFSHFIASLEDGRLHDHLSKQLQKLAESLTRHSINYGGKPKGKLALALDFSTDESGIFEIQADVKITEPKMKRPRSVMWVDHAFNMTPQNPRQQELFGLRDVTTSPTTVKQL